MILVSKLDTALQSNKATKFNADGTWEVSQPKLQWCWGQKRGERPLITLSTQSEPQGWEVLTQWSKIPGGRDGTEVEEKKGDQKASSCAWPLTGIDSR